VPAAREFMDLTAVELHSKIELIELDLKAFRCAVTAGKAEAVYGVYILRFWEFFLHESINPRIFPRMLWDLP